MKCEKCGKERILYGQTSFIKEQKVVIRRGYICADYILCGTGIVFDDEVGL